MAEAGGGSFGAAANVEHSLLWTLVTTRPTDCTSEGPALSALKFAAAQFVTSP